jgi:hypothetical protein
MSFARRTTLVAMVVAMVAIATLKSEIHHIGASDR